MTRIFRIFVLLVAGFAVTAAPALAADTMTEQQKIQALLGDLDSKDITFIRNGKSHDGAWAKKHLADKLKDAKDVTTADDFITKVASTSSHTGKPYMIKTADGKTVKAADWLQGKLAGMNSPASGTSTTDTPKE